MAFADPQSVTINAIANSLPRTSSGTNTGTFQKDDTTVALQISHNYAKRTRRVMRLTHNKVATDPLVPTINTPYSLSVSLVVDAPKVGYTVAEQKQIVDGLVAYLTASSGARVTQMLGGES
jgi:hypothetical protein